MKRILNWFRLGRLDGDLDRELQYHIDRRVTDLIAERPKIRSIVPLVHRSASNVLNGSTGEDTA